MEILQAEIRYSKSGLDPFEGAFRVGGLAVVATTFVKEEPDNDFPRATRVELTIHPSDEECEALRRWLVGVVEMRTRQPVECKE